MPTETLHDGLSSDTLQLTPFTHTIIDLERHFGQDLVTYQAQAVYNATFTLRLPPGVAPGDVTLLLDTGRTTVGFSSSGPVMMDTLRWHMRIKGQSDDFTAELRAGPLDNLGGLQAIEFADGTVWSPAQVLTQLRSIDHAHGIVPATSNADALQGDAANRLINGHGGNDTIVSGAGDETIVGGEGQDVFRFMPGWGHDQIRDLAADDVIEFGQGVAASQLRAYISKWDLVLDDGLGNKLELVGYSSYAPSGSSMPRIRFADGSSWSEAELGAQLRAGSTSSADAIPGTAAAERLAGGAGSDALFGRGGSDTLVGGMDNDLLDVTVPEDGVQGLASILQFATGFGQDIVRGFDPSRQQLKLEFQDGLKSTDMLVYRLTSEGVNTNDALIRFKSTGDSVRIGALFAANGSASLAFSDGTTLSAADLLSRGTAPLAADSFLVPQGTAGNDLLQAGLGQTNFDFSGGGSDTLQALPGFEFMYLKAGRPSLTERDTIELLDIRPEQLLGVTHSGNNGFTLTLPSAASEFSGFPARVIIDGAQAGDDLRAIDVKFADGTVWKEQDLISRILAGIEGKNDAISLSGRAESIDLHAGRGHDVLYGFQGGDANALDDTINVASKDISFLRKVIPGYYTYFGGTAGGRHYIPPSTSLVVTLNATGDSLTLSGIDAKEGGTSRMVSFTDGTFLTSGDIFQLLAHPETMPPLHPRPGALRIGSIFDDTLQGTDADDTLTGGGGQDRLSGGGGHDRVVFNLGDGHDVVVDHVETLQLGAGLKAADAQFGGHLYTPSLRFAGLADGVAFERELPDRIEFADGTVWQASDLRALAYLGTPFDDAIRGTDANDFITGRQGDDDLSGGKGRDTLIGGAGDDLISLGNRETEDEMTDLIVFNRGDGHDTVSVYNAVLQLGDGLTRDQLQISRTQGASGLIRFSDALDTIEIRNLFEQAHPVIKLADGSVLSDADIARLANRGTEQPDLIIGGNQADDIAGLGGNDVLNGGAGDDILSGGLGADRLIGGLGADTLDGGLGDDTYLHALGDGQDLIHADTQDTIALDAGLSRSSLIIGRLGALAPNTVVLGFQGSSDTLTLDKAGQWDGLKLSFADGSSLSGKDIMLEASKPLEPPKVDMVLTGTAGKDNLVGKAGNDTLSGLAGNDTLAGGTGNDRLIGGKGADTYVFNRGDGQDTVVDSDTSFLNGLFTPDLLKVGNAKSNQLWFTRTDSNLDIAIIGTADKVTIQDWYKGTANQVEKITALGDSKSLSAGKVNALVNAMAKFSAPAEGVTSLPTATQGALSKVLATSWT